MSLIRYEAFPFHRALLGDLSRAFDHAAPAASDYVPAVDIAEHADRFVLTADLPGVDPAAVEITLEKGVLTLAGSREKTVETKDVESRRGERLTGKFQRRFALPDSVDGESVTATGKHGVLEIVIPKRAAAQPRRISVTH